MASPTTDKSPAESPKVATPVVAPVADVVASDAPPISAFPDGIADPGILIIRETTPEDSEYGEQLFKRLSTGEVFKLAVRKDDPRGRTHFLKNKTHFANVSPEDFRAQFDRI